MVKAAAIHLLLLLLAIVSQTHDGSPRDEALESDLPEQLSNVGVMSRFRRMDCCRYNQVLNCCNLLWDWNE
ncbi:hypothetical protein OSTOST_08903 [Ostertagia ostertagi]